MSKVTQSEWDNFINQNQDAHLLQSGAWASLKSQFGWEPHFFIEEGCGAQVLVKNYPFGFKFAYLPKGPVGMNWNALWPTIHKFCRQNRVFNLRVEPDLWENADIQFDDQLIGFQRSTPIQPARTLLIELGESEDELLARMKQKTRYNIRLANKKGVKIHRSKNIDLFFAIMKVTGQRDEFGIHGCDYYQYAFNEFSKNNDCELLIASYQQKSLAGIMVFAQGKRAWYLYGASTDDERDRMPTYLLQWEAIRWARNKGCAEYDLWGVPDEEEQVLENNFLSRSDGLWGVYRFKRGFGGKLMRALGAWDYVYLPFRYKLFNFIIKKHRRQLG